MKCLLLFTINVKKILNDTTYLLWIYKDVGKYKNYILISGYVLISENFLAVVKLTVFEKGFKIHFKNYDLYFYFENNWSLA